MKKSKKKKRNKRIKDQPNVKNYLLDTNTLISSPHALFGFQDNNIYLSGTTLQELDHLKSVPGETGFNARKAIRAIEALRLRGKLRKGVPTKEGGKVFVEVKGIKKKLMPKEYSLTIPDNRIICTGLYLNKKLTNGCVLVTNDVSMRVNASVCGLDVQSYHNDEINTDEVYYGRRVIETEDPNIINEIYRNKTTAVPDMETPMEENEFAILKCGNQSALAIHKKGQLELIQNTNASFGIVPRNASQRFMLRALMAPVEEIPLVIILGKAGTAKTFLSMLAGIDGVLEGKYEKMIITRNNVTSDQDFGYLPGDMDNKAAYLTQNFYDALYAIVKGKGDEDKDAIIEQVEDLAENVIEFSPMAYMRGRSIVDSYLVMDEAQNSTRTQIRDVITRAGMGTKVVICGDINQIDNTRVDKRTNGLIFAANTMRSSNMAAILVVPDEDCQRSPLSSDAVKRMSSSWIGSRIDTDKQKTDKWNKENLF